MPPAFNEGISLIPGDLVNIPQIIRRQISIFHQLHNYRRAVFLSFTLPVIKLPNRSSNILYVGLIDVESRWMVEKIILCIFSVIKRPKTSWIYSERKPNAELSICRRQWCGIIAIDHRLSEHKSQMTFMNEPCCFKPCRSSAFMMKFHLVSFLYRQTFELHQLRNKRDLEDIKYLIWIINTSWSVCGRIFADVKLSTKSSGKLNFNRWNRWNITLSWGQFRQSINRSRFMHH